MVTSGGVAKVVDFGVAGVVGELSEADSVLFGTPAYVAPERLQGGPVAAGTDLYGFGVLMYRMLSGHMPWPAETTTQMLVAHLRVEPDPLPPLTGLPGDVIDIIAECLAKEPADRPAAADVAAVLAAAAAAHAAPGSAAGQTARAAGVGAARWRVGTRPAGTQVHRRRRQLAMAGAAVLVIAAAVAAASGGPGGTPRAGSAPITARDGTTGTASSPGVGGVGVADPPSGSESAQPGSGAGPAGPNAVDPRPANPPAVTGTATAEATDPGPTPEPPAAVERSASEAGNSVTVRCTGSTATIVAATPAAGWSVTRIQPGPSDQVNVKFESASIAPNRVTFKGRCHNGIPRINPDTG